MTRTDKVTRLLIANGYDDELATNLPKLFIADFFEKEQEKLSEAVDIFIDCVQRGSVIPNEKGFVNFAGITKMEKRDFENSCNGLFYDFNSSLEEKFFHKINRLPLKNILQNGGAFSNEGGYLNYSKPIVGTPQEYTDLYEVSPYNGNINKIYIRANDLYSLLEEKGFSGDMISTMCGEYGLGPRYPKAIKNEGVYINYNSIMDLGNIDKQEQKKM